MQRAHGETPGKRRRKTAASLGFLFLLAAASQPASAAVAVRSGPDGAPIAERLAAADLPEPLVAAGPTIASEDKALLAAVAAWKTRRRPDDFSSLTSFLAGHPNSAWRVAVEADLGLAYLHYGYLSRATAALGAAWHKGRQATELRARRLVDRAAGELVRLEAQLGREQQLAALLGEIGNRPVTGAATELVQMGHDTLWVMRHDPKHLYLCGPAALRALMLAQHRSRQQVAYLGKVRAGPEGTSLAELAALADEGHLPVAIVFRKPAEKVPVPSVMHWRLGHFAAIVGESNGRFHVADPSFGPGGLWLTRAAIDAEASGYFLVPKGAVSAPDWRRVAAAEAGRVWAPASSTTTAATRSAATAPTPRTATPTTAACAATASTNRRSASI